MSETDPPVLWENSWPQYKTSPGGLAIVEEMDGIAQVVREDLPTRYDGQGARQGIEIQISAEESGHPGKQQVALQTVTEHETGMPDKFR